MLAPDCRRSGPASRLDLVDDILVRELMRIAITGATGMVGRALGHALLARGFEVIPVSRRPLAGGLCWDPDHQAIDGRTLGTVDAVVHLAGENLARGRWTARRRAELVASRVPVTRWLAETLAAMRAGPRHLISASAVGIYGSRADECLTEASATGSDFLARLATDWEKSTAPAWDAGIRVMNPRFGVILARDGGALARLLPIFRLGLGGPFGSGRQWMSWIAIDDVVSGIEHALRHDGLAGPVNFTAPEPVSNLTFARTLGRVLHRPAHLPVPVPLLRIVLGEMADATILASQRATPAVLTASGFEFAFSQLEPCLRNLLDRRPD